RAWLRILHFLRQSRNAWDSSCTFHLQREPIRHRMVTLCTRMPIAFLFQINGFPPAEAAEDVGFGIGRWQAPSATRLHRERNAQAVAPTEMVAAGDDRVCRA